MSFGSHGGHDHYVVTNEAEVDRLLIRDVSESDLSAFRAELAAAAPYATDPRIRNRVHLAMLYLADGDLPKLRRARELADVDWRDLLVQAEYPSTPPRGHKETPDEKKSRQAEDIRGVADWRNRDNT